MDPNTVMEAAAESAKAMTKFQEIVQKIFNPRWTKEQADADMDVYERKIQLIREHPDMDIVFVGDEMHARKATPEELSARAEQRMLADAVRQENNIENVLNNTVRELQETKAAADQSIDDDWIARFFNIVKDVSNEEMQYIWGKILAGEIASPKSFSLRTLETLRNMSTAEAQVFQRIIPLVVHSGSSYFISSSNETLEKCGSSFADVLTLDECGLLNASGTLSLNLSLTKSENEVILGTDYLIMLKGLSVEKEEMRIGIHTLTKAGIELYQILSHSINEQYAWTVERYMWTFAQQIFEGNGNRAQISVHKLVSLRHNGKNDSVEYEQEPIVLFGAETTAVS